MGIYWVDYIFNQLTSRRLQDIIELLCSAQGEKYGEGEKSRMFGFGGGGKISDGGENGRKTEKKSFVLWCAFAAASLAVLSFNYFTISFDLHRDEALSSGYSGYGLIGCLQGSVGLSGYMVILLIITNIAALATGIAGAAGCRVQAGVLRESMVIESIFYLLSAIVPYFNLKNALEKYDSLVTVSDIGLGCYLNILLAVTAAVYCFCVLRKQWKMK